ncbi:TetR/AcrR family transcriptional regulator [Tengunoibacter tsumagoiensis]|uniref:HTH tetR-type domain-containing protein n=1 Tax=Tengunoibacter tsumagoiensis TaxID=2014871 RepID=A0A402A885_9CHLR|nr:TetR/AcrR family transcriptional regulator [Tengunoibacter tsumagoiensis]GCE15374.1 hypothetical protein KTT_52330 [Tengunoibacter tsumagoiensis]
MKDPVKASLQEQLAVARRAQILDAAIKVFAQKGFHTTTIKDIAREADLADGTIYKYFENKTALLLGILEPPRTRAQQEMSFLLESDADIHSVMKAFMLQPLMAFKKDNFELFKVIISEILVNQELRERFHQQVLGPMLQGGEAYLRRWSEQGVISPQNIDLTIRAIAGMILGLLLEQSMGDQTLEAQWDELPDTIASLIVNGIKKEPL